MSFILPKQPPTLITSSATLWIWKNWSRTPQLFQKYTTSNWLKLHSNSRLTLSPHSSHHTIPTVTLGRNVLLPGKSNSMAETISYIQNSCPLFWDSETSLKKKKDIISNISYCLKKWLGTPWKIFCTYVPNSKKAMKL